MDELFKDLKLKVCRVVEVERFILKSTILVQIVSAYMYFGDEKSKLVYLSYESCMLRFGPISVFCLDTMPK